MSKDIASASAYFPEALQFRPGWTMEDLPGVERQRDAFYDGSPLESLPPTVPGSNEDFPFYAAMAQPSEEERRRVLAVSQKMLEDYGIALPTLFTQFMSSRSARETIQMGHDCYFSLGKTPLLMPTKGVALKFLRDNTNYGFWYIYFPLSDKSKHCVIRSSHKMEWCIELSNRREVELRAQASMAVSDPCECTDRCSPNFDDFIRRWYIENKICMMAAGGHSSEGFTPAMKTYYAQAKLAVSKKMKIMLIFLAVKDMERFHPGKSPLRLLPKEMLRLVLEALPIF